MVLVIVYVGAVAVLFLFVVMMLDINFVALREGFLQYLPVGGMIGIVLMFELILVAGSWALAPDIESVAAEPLAKSPGLTNTELLGGVLYTKYIFLFQASGMVLLVAMIGAIVLTLRGREGVRRQKISRQVARRAEETVELKKVPIGGGV
jgi:NADH-quinone oxidoreductase subunit J